MDSIREDTLKEFLADIQEKTTETPSEVNRRETNLPGGVRQRISKCVAMCLEGVEESEVEDCCGAR